MKCGMSQMTKCLNYAQNNDHSGHFVIFCFGTMIGTIFASISLKTKLNL